jgi:hypothetical protein
VRLLVERSVCSQSGRARCRERWRGSVASFEERDSQSREGKAMSVATAPAERTDFLCTAKEKHEEYKHRAARKGSDCPRQPQRPQGYPLVVPDHWRP